MTLFDLIVLAFILFCAYFGWEAGMWTAGVAALELLACLTLGVLLHETVGALLMDWVLWQVSSDFSQTWGLLLAFVGLSWGLFALIRRRLHTKETVDLDHVDIDPLSDRIGGVIAGGIGGALCVGGVLVTMSMMPLLASFKPSGDKLVLDVGKLVLWTAGHFATDRPDGYEGPPLPIVGGPVSTQADTRALLTCEPWVDVDADSAFNEEKDRYRDVDGDGSYTKDLYAVDVDGTGMRRIGLIDKYVVGCWDINLMAAVRKRTDVKRADPKPKKPGGAGSSTGEKPIETDF